MNRLHGIARRAAKPSRCTDTFGMIAPARSPIKSNFARCSMVSQLSACSPLRNGDITSCERVSCQRTRGKYSRESIFRRALSAVAAIGKRNWLQGTLAACVNDGALSTAFATSARISPIHKVESKTAMRSQRGRFFFTTG
jgi:hypothetical protein